MSAGRELSAFVSARTGIELSRGGIDRALDAYATRRQKELSLTLPSYLGLLAGDRGSAELERLINSITVGYTWFFRDEGQLAAIEALLAGELGRPGKVRVWIPACSTGEDAYSLAFMAERAEREVELLATDLNTQSVEHARRGVYGSWSVRDMDPRFSANLTRLRDRRFEVAQRFRQRVSFAAHNLLDRAPAPASGEGWDVVLCRNVLIYFDRETARQVLDSLTRSLAPGGYLVLGASEVVCEVPPGLDAHYVAGRLVFRKRDFRKSDPVVSGEGRAARAVARDWLLEPANVRQPAPLISALPVAGELLESVPPAPATNEVERELARGHRLLEAGDVAQARLAYLAALSHDRTRADTHLYAGVARYLCGEIELALHDLRAALFLDEGLWPAAFYLALCHENSGHPAEALQSYEHVVRIHDRKRASLVTFGSVFDAWREDLCAVARRRVQAAGAGARRAG
ncbi:MAG TPA: CheR family methyltransferase [Polyangiaceae bacterium]|nr:CheR family methyltransferase [Polyangiaceae bacterium]